MKVWWTIHKAKLDCYALWVGPSAKPHTFDLTIHDIILTVK